MHFLEVFGLRTAAYLKKAAVAKQPATLTTALYDRRRGDVSLGEVNRIVI
jgi:hypothetical protein